MQDIEAGHMGSRYMISLLLNHLFTPSKFLFILTALMFHDIFVFVKGVIFLKFLKNPVGMSS